MASSGVGWADRPPATDELLSPRAGTSYCCATRVAFADREPKGTAICGFYGDFTVETSNRRIRTAKSARNA